MTRAISTAVFMFRSDPIPPRPHKRTAGLPPAVIARNDRDTNFLRPLDTNPPRRLRRTFDDKSTYRGGDFLYHENTEQWQPASGTRETKFYLGFYRKPVVGNDAERLQNEAAKEEIKASRRPLRQSTLAHHLGQSTKEAQSLSAPHREYGGRKHFHNNSSVVLGETKANWNASSGSYNIGSNNNNNNNSSESFFNGGGSTSSNNNNRSRGNVSGSSYNIISGEEKPSAKDNFTYMHGYH